MYRISLLIILLATTYGYGADIIIRADGSKQHIITQEDGLTITETTATATFADILKQELYYANQLSYRITVITPKTATQRSLSCNILAIELHFNPDDQPIGSGYGLWVATNPDDVIAEQIAQNLLDTWATKTHTPYASTPLHHRQPRRYDNTQRHTCPALYINLDTFPDNQPRLWIRYPRATHYYARDLAHAIISALRLVQRMSQTDI